MQEKTYLDTLPADLLNLLVEQYGVKNGVKNLVLVNRGFLNFFDPQPQRKQRLHAKLLEQVAKGEQDKVEKILTVSPELLLEQGDVTDYSGRKFKNVYVFQIPVWALDVRYMAPMIIHCLPKNEKGETIRKALLNQFNDVVTKGVTYELNGKFVTESHYDFALKNELKDYVDNNDNRTPTELENHWCTRVGGSQWLIPAHVAQHYCDPEESFDPTPSFKKEKFSRVLKFWNLLTDKEESWFDARSGSSGLGLNFGIWHRAAARLPRALGGGFVDVDVSHDLAAVTALCEVRTAEDLKSLKTQLETPLVEKLEVYNDPRNLDHKNLKI